MNEVKKVSSASVAALMSIAFISMGVGTITPAIQSIMAAFPKLPVTTLLLISTLPSLLIIPSSLFAGAVAGTKAKYKTLAAAGIGLFVIGGIMPAFTINSFTVILVERAIFGIGLGIISPLGNALILGLYEGQKRAGMLGLWTVIANVGGIVLQFLGGFFAGIKWHYSFYPHALGVLSLILVIMFLPEPAESLSSETAVGQKAKLGGRVWFISLLFGIAMMMIYPMLVNMSTLLMSRGLGGSAVSGVVLSFFTIGGMLSGMAFGNLYKISRRYIIAIAGIILTLGLAAVVYGSNVVMVTAGATLVGFAFSTLMPAINMIFGMLIQPELFAMAMSVLIAAMNLLAFCSTYWIGIIGKITGDPVNAPLFIAMLFFAAMSVVFLIVNPFPKQKSEAK